MQKVLFIQYAHSAAFPPLEHSSRILADARWQVLFLSVSAPSCAEAAKRLVELAVVAKRLVVVALVLVELRAV